MRNHDEVWLHCETLLTPFKRHEDCVLHITGGRIDEILPSPHRRNVPESLMVREPGAVVVPGFIDVHVHGAGGKDVMEGTLESLETISATLARYGTTSFLATTISAPDPQTAAVLRALGENREKVTAGAVLLGIHMEGPYLNATRRGTHLAQHLKPASLQEFRRFVELSGNTVRKITLAPEMDPEFTLTRAAAEAGIQVSLGHSDATFEQARAAVAAGAQGATHLFNAMRPFHQREPGILGLALIEESVYAEIIVDGIHVHAVALRLLLRAKEIDRILLVTDGTSAVGMPDGIYRLGDKSISVSGGRCCDSEGNLAGSTLTLDRAIRYLVNQLDLPLGDALSAGTASPARSLGIAGRKGIVAPGADADLVFLDGNLNVTKTMIGGRIVYSRGETGTKS
jgi:N-acetylglucosamine-6-phosphate deacetylase